MSAENEDSRSQSIQTPSIVKLKLEDVSSENIKHGESTPDYEPPKSMEQGEEKSSSSLSLFLQLFLAVTAATAIIVYASLRSDVFDPLMAVVTVSAAAITAIWVTALLRRLHNRKPLKESSGSVVFSLALVAVMGVTAAVFTGVVPFSDPTEESTIEDGSVYYGMQPPYALRPWEDDSVQLVNSEDATDPTWEELKAFLQTDKTDQKDYDPLLFLCGSFAEEVHNNAEAAGIKAAWVVVEFEGENIGHALNAFNTTDKGLVWIDCTSSWSEPPPWTKPYGGADSQDKVAYVVIGKEYGLISLDAASSPGYAYYEEYMQRKLDYKSTLDDYYTKAKVNMSDTERYDMIRAAVPGRFSPGSSIKATGTQEWHGQLERETYSLYMLAENLGRERESLGLYWGPLGTVSNVEIYW